MSKLKPIKYEELMRKLSHAGYVMIRKSKHLIYFHPHKEITIPIPHKHRGNVRLGLLNAIVREMKISKEEFNQL